MTIPKIQLSQKPTYVKLAEDVDFFELFKHVEERFETCFIFESLGEEGKFARYSILGFDPAHIISARGQELRIDGKGYEVKNPYYALRELMPEQSISRNYTGGFIGYISYDAVNYMEPAVNVKVHPDFEPMLFGAYKDGLVFDKLTNELFYFHYGDDRRALLSSIAHDTSRPKSF